MIGPRTALGTLSGGGLLLALAVELLAGSLVGDGLIFWAGALVTAALALYWLVPRLRAWLAARPRQTPTDPAHAELRSAAELAGQWLEALGTEGGGMVAAEWFEREEPTLRRLLDTTDPTADRVDDLAAVGDALDAWYVRQDDGTALLELSERLAAIGEQTHRRDLRQLAAVRAATAHRLLGDLAAADDRLGSAAALAARGRVAAAIRTRRRLEQGLVHLGRADRCEPGVDRDDAIAAARDRFDQAGLAVPRADLAADLAIHVHLAVTYLYRHDPAAALDQLRLASSRAAATRDAGAEAHVLELTGVAAWLQGNPDGAKRWWRQAEQRYADIDERVGRARCLQHLGAAAFTAGSPARALTLLEASAALRGGAAGHEVLEHYLTSARAQVTGPAEAAPPPPTPRPQAGLLAWLHRWWTSATR